LENGGGEQCSNNSSDDEIFQRVRSPLRVARTKEARATAQRQDDAQCILQWPEFGAKERKYNEIIKKRNTKSFMAMHRDTHADNSTRREPSHDEETGRTTKRKNSGSGTQIAPKRKPRETKAQIQAQLRAKELELAIIQGRNEAFAQMSSHRDPVNYAHV